MSLECDCGCPVFDDRDNLYWEGESAICPSCGRECVISVDEGDVCGEYDGEPLGRAYVSVSEDAIDVGQPQCDGTGGCHAVEKWISEGHRCRFDCKRVTEKQRQRAKGDDE